MKIFLNFTSFIKRNQEENCLKFPDFFKKFTLHRFGHSSLDAGQNISRNISYAVGYSFCDIEIH